MSTPYPEIAEKVSFSNKITLMEEQSDEVILRRVQNGLHNANKRLLHSVRNDEVDGDSGSSGKNGLKAEVFGNNYQVGS